MKKIDLKNKNFTMKIVAAFFAFIMWTYVMSEVNPRIVKPISNVKVEILNEESLEENNLTLMDISDDTITVEVRGRRNDVINIKPSDITATIDLKGYRAGINKVPIKIPDLYNAEIVDSSPELLTVNIDKLIEKQMPISVELIGDPIDGYAAGEIDINPSEVLVKGPRSIVNNVDKVRANVNIDGIQNDIKRTVPMKLLNSDGDEISRLEKDPNTVNVEVSILKLKEVSVEPVIKGNPLVDHEITDVEIEPKKVTIKGREDVLEGVETIKTKPIDISYESDDLDKQVELDLPEGIYLVGDKELKINVKISENEKNTFEFDKNDIKAKNIDEGLKFKLAESEDDTNVSISITALEDIMKDLDKNDFELFIDLKDISEGEHTVDIEVNTPEGVILESIDPKTLKIVVEVKDESEDEDEGSEDNNIQDENTE
ncbi:CdaR family protein [Senegalia massiliensis]|uniref:CdaR family protein n=1 Tax=Senegalia massiliensis TaxID=1720316 RepID=UPI001031F062|nr:CdaR family protein [Senegalia massiliensis]